MSVRVWHLPDHYKKDVPSESLIREWNAMIRLKKMQDPEQPYSLADDQTQSVIRNGILFPIWQMKSCKFNDSAGLPNPLRNNHLSVTWLPDPEEIEKRVKAGIPE